MANRSKTVEVTFLVDDREANKKLGNIEQSVGKTAKGFGSAATVIKTGFAAVAGSAILDVVGKMDALNVKAEATERRFNTVFGEITAEARAWAEEQKAAFGLSQTGMEGLMASAQDLLVPLGFTREAAFDLSQEILLTANALSEWTGGTRTAAEAQEIATKAILGEREGLVELGVKISDADVKAELLKRGQDKLTGAAEAQATAQATLTLITAKSTDALSAYEDRTGTAIAEQKEMESAVLEASASWAEFFKPAIEDAKESLGDFAYWANIVSGSMVTAEDAQASWLQTALSWIDPIQAGSDLLGVITTKHQEWTEAVKAGTEAVSETENPFQGVVDNMVEVAGSTDTATVALQDFEDEVRSQMDPIFNLIQKVNDLDTAQLNSSIARDKYGEGSPQHREALRKEAESWLSVKDAQIKAANEAGLTRDAFQKVLEDMQIFTHKDIELILKDFDRVNDYEFRDKTIRTRVVRGDDTRSIARAAGGPVAAGRSYLVGEAGPEVVTMGSQGSVTPNHRLRNGGGGSETIIIQVDGREIARAVRNHDRSLLPG